MLDSINAIFAFVKDRNRGSLDTDRLLCSAIVRELEILGEAAGKVFEEMQMRFPVIPWKQIIGMRNRLIHAYFDVDHEIIWKTIHDSLPSLHTDLEKILAEIQK